MHKKAQHPDVAFSYAPGKIILVGEHAVVYGAKAIAMPIDIGVRVAVYQDKSSRRTGLTLKGVGPFLMGEVSLLSPSSGPKILQTALSYVRDTFGECVDGLSLVVDGNLPPGRGLGSSAALSVAMIKALHQYAGWSLEKDLLKKYAGDLETIFHGSPSGIDHTVVINEQAIGFKRVDGQAAVWPITLRSPLRFVVALSGPHDGTKNAVLELAERKKRHEKAYERIFAALDEVAQDMEKSLGEGHQAFLGELMNIAHGYLNALSLSTPEIEKLVAIARERGALGAKLTGAGGGGAVIVLVDGNEAGIKNAFKAAGYQSFVTDVL